MKYFKNKLLLGIGITFFLITLGIACIGLYSPPALTHSTLNHLQEEETESPNNTADEIPTTPDKNTLAEQDTPEEDNIPSTESEVINTETIHTDLEQEDKQDHSSDISIENEIPSQTKPDSTNKPIENEIFSEELNPSEEALLQAGIGVVIQLDTAKFAVLSNADGTIHGQDGGLYLIEYLAALGLEGSVSGGWLPNADYYCYTANQVHEKLNPNDETSWE